MVRKLAIFGISGRTGHELARVAGIRGWEVCGFVRPTSKDEGAIVIGRIVQGNFDDFDRVVETIADSKAVCCLIWSTASLYRCVLCEGDDCDYCGDEANGLQSVGLPNWCDDRTCAKPIAPDGVDGSDICEMASSGYSRSGKSGAPCRIEWVGLDDRETATIDRFGTARANPGQCLSSSQTLIQDQSCRSCSVHPRRNTNRTFCGTTNICEGLPLHMIPKHKGMSVRSHTEVPMGVGCQFVVKESTRKTFVATFRNRRCENSIVTLNRSKGGGE